MDDAVDRCWAALGSAARGGHSWVTKVRSQKESRDNTAEGYLGSWEADEEGLELEDDIDVGGERRSWKRACAARRSIERYQERRRLKAWLTDVFDDEDEGARLLDYEDFELDEDE